ncbi:hypothetical protein KIN20_017903 [Parelaphostrongylus tenuis]|uniref:Uncharacterized protein n=1 Tax=Parelaphostrongylus tenuis TaxID=148309 RepID=A0AAD5QR44_PARTN|nr:hypothetical protein KIN20_017903 [Parelaphostrongylus tenuis]
MMQRKQGRIWPIWAGKLGSSAVFARRLSPSDLHLFRSLKHWLDKKKLRRGINHLRRELAGWFASNNNEFYEREIDLLRRVGRIASRETEKKRGEEEIDVI